jgi:hypothetical protein
MLLRKKKRTKYGKDWFHQKKNLEKLGYHSYYQYLKSPAWLKIKNYVDLMQIKDCFICGGRYEILHHLSYRFLGKSVSNINIEKRLINILPLCKKCHDQIHQINHSKKTSVLGATTELCQIHKKKLDKLFLYKKSKEINAKQNKVDISQPC